MSKPVDSINALYRAQWRTWAAIANFALRRTAEYHDVGTDAARQALAANIKQCEALLSAETPPAWRALPGAPAPWDAHAAAEWQARWLELAAHAQMDMTRLHRQLIAEWSAATAPGSETDTPSSAGTAQPALPVAPLFDALFRSWEAAIGGMAKAVVAAAPAPEQGKRAPARRTR
jgi:hypothetical protein